MSQTFDAMSPSLRQISRETQSKCYFPEVQKHWPKYAFFENVRQKVQILEKFGSIFMSFAPNFVKDASACQELSCTAKSFTFEEELAPMLLTLAPTFESLALLFGCK